MIKNMLFKAHAKINIGLKIINKRDDGYHNLETIFYPVKLHDEVTVNIIPSKRNTNSVLIKTNSKIVPTDKTNLCFKVIESFFRVFGIKEYFVINIFIGKNIPIGGGLGGGSTDAATVLKYLIKYFNINVSDKKKDILNIALTVGSDVPFFLIQKPCFAQGRGELIAKLDNFNLDNYRILLVNPNMHVTTRWAFENLGMQPGVVNESDLKNVREFNPSVFEILKNDFEGIVFNKYPELEAIKNELNDFGSVFSSMSGSGATMYGLFDSSNEDAVKKACEYFKSKNYFVFVS
jgi:4-diphosphocytidyl-2-C-methyl-D-erythritol kinase